MSGIAAYARHQGSWSFFWKASGFEKASVQTLELDADGIITRDFELTDEFLARGLPAVARVFASCATISDFNQNVESLRGTYSYTDIEGGYPVHHLSAHLNGKIPSGANLLMLDGHVEWRKFQAMHPRTLAGSPVFWW